MLLVMIVSAMRAAMAYWRARPKPRNQPRDWPLGLAIAGLPPGSRPAMVS
jgi:hypothetical protein